MRASIITKPFTEPLRLVISLTVDLVNKLERVPRTCLKVILAENYISYEAALEMCNLDTFYQRREDRCKEMCKTP